MTETERLLEDLAHFVSHELRNPLSAVMGYAQILEESVADASAVNVERVRMIAGRILERADHMNDLIALIQAMANAALGRLDLDPRPLSLGALLADGLTTLPGDVAMRVRVEIADDADRFAADSWHLCRAILNLVANAAKYSDADAPIEISAARDGDLVSIAVTDHGPGMPPEVREHVLDGSGDAVTSSGPARRIRSRPLLRAQGSRGARRPHRGRERAGRRQHVHARHPGHGALAADMERHYEDMGLEGHLIDSLIVSQIMDEIVELDGEFETLDFEVGRTNEDTSHAVLRVSGRDETHLELLLEAVQRHGAVPLDPEDVDARARPGRRRVPRGLLLDDEPRDVRAHRGRLGARRRPGDGPRDPRGRVRARRGDRADRRRARRRPVRGRARGRARHPARAPARQAGVRVHELGGLLGEAEGADRRRGRADAA